jgi:hypothetical protein
VDTQEGGRDWNVVKLEGCMHQTRDCSVCLVAVTVGLVVEIGMCGLLCCGL